MKRPIAVPSLVLILSILALRIISPGRAAESNEDASSRKLALDLAGAFSNDGFKLRDGHWSGHLARGKAQIIQVNLYGGNQYWFSLAATPPAKKVAITLYDETGAPVNVDAYTDGPKAAAGFSPTFSGPFFLKVELLTGEPSDFCLIYSYK